MWDGVIKDLWKGQVVLGKPRECGRGGGDDAL